ncbi:hypothetical protein SAMN05216203_0629 [Marinobacter daqiaonensis]|uniref:Globin n=1 Tax=Marinobacter daqiaonensis TaxID=650891 RepID=A0A1I6GZE4_9GAMM|nr:globin [Marinobacter daqiaonensis]SFR47519.1 hypothetical protein SAMN05216203_0629 [Marinobacter daqiaonensis]
MYFENLFDSSYERIRQQGDAFFEAFYQRFLASSCLVRQKFYHTDMVAQRRMLKKSFYSMVVFYATGSADGVLVEIGHSHSARRYNVIPALYDFWLESLIATIRQFDSQCDDDVELAWRLVLSPGITYLKFKYDHSGVPSEPRRSA